MSTQYEHLNIQRDGAIATVQMNRPDKANALNYEHLRELAHAADSFRDDGEIRVVIFVGAGRHFSSGADLSDPGEAYRTNLVLRRRRLRAGEEMIAAVQGMDQITIAAWRRAAMGGGACLAFACDFRVGSDNCFAQFPEIDIGLNLMWKSLPLVVALVGPARAKRLVVGGERADAQRLEAWGVLDDRVADDQLEATAEQLASFYAGKPPIAAQMIKRSVNAISNALGPALMHMDADQNLLASGTQDRATAVKAYLNKESPTFTGD